MLVVSGHGNGAVCYDVIAVIVVVIAALGVRNGYVGVC